MDLLAPDIKRRIAQCLDSKDVLSMGQVNKRTRTDLAVSALSPPLDFIRNRNWTDPTDTPCCGPEIPLVYGARATHSVTLTCVWMDQGWGNRKSQLFIVGRNTSNEFLPITPRSEWTIDNGYVLYSSPIATHHAEKLTITFHIRDDCDAYHLWYKVGHGGDHQLFVNNVKVHCIVYDDGGRTGSDKASRVKTYKALESLGILSGTVQRSLNTAVVNQVAERRNHCLYERMSQVLDPSDDNAILVAQLASLGLSEDEIPISALRALSNDEVSFSALRELGKFLTEYPLRA